jgi:hypothetical protein
MYDFPDSFYYTVYDPFGQFSDGSVSINVLCPAPPLAETQTFETPAQVHLLQQLVVVSSAPLTFDVTLQPQHGSLQDVDALGQCVYVPDYDFCR